MKKRTISALIGVIAGILVGEAVYFGYRWLSDNRMSALEKDAIVRIYPGMTMDQVIGEISSECGLKHPSSIERIFADENLCSTLKPGSYFLKADYSARYIARMLTRGWQDPVNLVISGRIQTKAELARIISLQMMSSRAELLRAMNDSAFLSSIGTTPDNVFEMIIPDTYEMYWSASAEQILSRLKKDRDRFWNENRVELAQKQGLTPKEVSVLASIVSEETHYAEEYPKIASVYLTRLRRGIQLQACPTVCYLYDYKLSRVLNSHLKTDSPYNTYLYKGLPPGPIALPGKEHIEAVLHPDSTPYMFFCADSSFNGHNVFSKTYEEHLQRKKEYVKALELRKRQKALEKSRDAAAKEK